MTWFGQLAGLRTPARGKAEQRSAPGRAWRADLAAPRLSPRLAHFCISRTVGARLPERWKLAHLGSATVSRGAAHVRADPRWRRNDSAKAMLASRQSRSVEACAEIGAATRR
eukprot:CAMPEP_0176222616 /NCGR_PEP_ID=MMETSP0121_2-20121125/20328_1 /TAXON_ID=160619 /ORGANISM="Kryptoperidinium foliaceum, Strain CCMP 1326" /LENGTH=111 /DNA_ID=CAMNT_0017561839 /DNA_START=55 /DNA_END=387 /DNA_ORIENTATION=-